MTPRIILLNLKKILPYSMIIPSFMTVGSQMPELDQEGAFLSPPPPHIKKVVKILHIN